MAKILIVDDEPLICRALQLLLESRGHTLEVADTVDRAIELSARFKPALLIVDCMLGDRLDGLQLVELLRADYPNLPVLMVTGYASPELEVQILATPRMRLVRKPSPTEFLVREIDEMLQLRSGA